jgi:hypothetical protein
LGVILVVDRFKPPELRYDELMNALHASAPMPEGVYGISTATAYYSDGFALDAAVLPDEVEQVEPGFIVVEPLQGAMARAWHDFATFRADSAAVVLDWSVCVEECVGATSRWIDGEGCEGESTCVECEVDCATDTLTTLAGYAAARAACEAACTDDVCIAACEALDPIVLSAFPGDAVVIGNDQLLSIELREPGE